MARSGLAPAMVLAAILLVAAAGLCLLAGEHTLPGHACLLLLAAAAAGALPGLPAARSGAVAPPALARYRYCRDLAAPPPRA